MNYIRISPLLLLALPCFQAHAQIAPDAPELSNTVLQISALKTLDCEGGVGFEQVPGQAHVLYDRLGQVATTPELLQLTKHGSRNVRIAALLNLDARHHPDTFYLALPIMRDMTRIGFFCGCIPLGESASTILLWDLRTSLNSWQRFLRDQMLYNSHSWASYLFIPLIILIEFRVWLFSVSAAIILALLVRRIFRRGATAHNNM